MKPNPPTNQPSIYPIDRTLSGATTSDQSGPGNDIRLELQESYPHL